MVAATEYCKAAGAPSSWAPAELESCSNGAAIESEPRSPIRPLGLGATQIRPVKDDALGTRPTRWTGIKPREQPQGALGEAEGRDAEPLTAGGRR